MSEIRKQIYCLLAVSGLNSFQLAGASWVALLAARGFSLVEIGLAESCFHLASLLFEIPSGVIADVFAGDDRAFAAGGHGIWIISFPRFTKSGVCANIYSVLNGKRG